MVRQVGYAAISIGDKNTYLRGIFEWIRRTIKPTDQIAMVAKNYTKKARKEHKRTFWIEWFTKHKQNRIVNVFPCLSHLFSQLVGPRIWTSDDFNNSAYVWRKCCRCAAKYVSKNCLNTASGQHPKWPPSLILQEILEEWGQGIQHNRVPLSSCVPPTLSPTLPPTFAVSLLTFG